MEAALTKRAAAYGGGTLEADRAELAALRAGGRAWAQRREHVLRIRISEREILQLARAALQQVEVGAAADAAAAADEMWGLFD